MTWQNARITTTSSTTGTNVREQANLNARIVGALHVGDSIRISDTPSGDWQEVELASGVKGWAHGAYFTVQRESPYIEVRIPDELLEVYETEDVRKLASTLLYALADALYHP